MGQKPEERHKTLPTKTKERQEDYKRGVGMEIKSIAEKLQSTSFIRDRERDYGMVWWF